VVGVIGTSAFGERGVRGVVCAWGSDDGRGVELKRMIGRRAPLGHRGWTSTTNGTAESESESSVDVLSSDSLEDDAARENVGSGKLSELARGFSKTE